MRLYIIVHICLFLLLISCLEAFSQQPHLRLSFRRQNNFTYTTGFDTQYKYIGEKYQLSLNLHHDHLINTSRRNQPFVQVYFHTDIWQYFKLRKNLELVSWYLSDQFFNTENQRYNLYGGLKYNWKEYLEFTPFVGYSWDFRMGFWDNGVSPGLIISSRYAWPDGAKMQTKLFARLKYISPRHQRNIILQSQWTKRLSGIMDVAVNLKAGTHEINSYRSISVEKIKSDTIAPEIRFRYQLMPGLFWDSNNGFAFSRRAFDYELVERDTTPEFNNLSFNHLDIYTQQKISFGSLKWNAYLQFVFEDLSRRYQLENSQNLSDARFQGLLTREKQKDFARRMNLWELLVQYQLSLRHQLSFSASNRYVQYDTQAEDNFDDHDELNHIISLEWKARWAQNFSTEYKMLGNYRQYAFLFQERSQDNYTQRALRMDFSYRWDILNRLNMKGSQFIYVTYNVKDFDDPNLTDRSTRNLESLVEFNYRASSRWQMELSAYRKEVHQSYLDWENFTETTLDTNVIYIFKHNQSIRLKRPWKNHLFFADVGYKHTGQLRRLNTTLSDTRNALRAVNLRINNLQTGPVTGIRVKKRSPASLELSVWWQWQRQTFNVRDTQAPITSSTSFRQDQIDSGTSQFRPFFELQVSIWIGKI